MKNIILLISTLALFGLVACGGDSTTTSEYDTDRCLTNDGCASFCADEVSGKTACIQDCTAQCILRNARN